MAFADRQFRPYVRAASVSSRRSDGRSHRDCWKEPETLNPQLVNWRIGELIESFGSRCDPDRDRPMNVTSDHEGSERFPDPAGWWRPSSDGWRSFCASFADQKC